MHGPAVAKVWKAGGHMGGGHRVLEIASGGMLWYEKEGDYGWHRAPLGLSCITHARQPRGQGKARSGRPLASPMYIPFRCYCCYQSHSKAEQVCLPTLPRNNSQGHSGCTLCPLATNAHPCCHTTAAMSTVSTPCPKCTPILPWYTQMHGTLAPIAYLVETE